MASTLRKASYALACWSGLAGAARRRGARILIGHGTPARAMPALERQLAYLRRQFRVVPLADLVRRLADPEADVDRQVALTFDDGLRSNVSHAYPLLRRLGLHATLFVCPGLVDERQWIWTHEARWRLRALGEDEDQLVEWMKALDPATRQDALEALRRATSGLRPDAADREAYDLAGWDELRSLDPRIVDIGSHSLTHPILPNADRDSLEHEIGGSRRRLEERLQRPVELFCYPNGDNSPAVLECVRRHYTASVGDKPGCVQRGAARHVLPRLHLPGGTLRLASRLHAAAA